jgi:hypothetical protein
MGERFTAKKVPSTGRRRARGSPHRLVGPARR